MGVVNILKEKAFMLIIIYTVVEICLSHFVFILYWNFEGKKPLDTE